MGMHGGWQHEDTSARTCHRAWGYMGYWELQPWYVGDLGEKKVSAGQGRAAVLTAWRSSSSPPPKSTAPGPTPLHGYVPPSQHVVNLLISSWRALSAPPKVAQSCCSSVCPPVLPDGTCGGAAGTEQDRKNPESRRQGGELP